MNTKDCCLPSKDKASLLPLYILLMFVLISSVTLSYIFPSQVFMMYLMGIWFLSFWVLKLIDLPSFALSFSRYDLIANKWIWYGYMYPFIEILLWAIYIWDTSMKYIYPVITLSLIISILGMISAYRVVSWGKSIVCACMGTYWKLPMTKVTIVENGVMIMMIIFMILFPSSMMQMSGMPMLEDSTISAGMMTTWSSDENDPMREHCKMMPEMWGCEKYK